MENHILTAESYPGGGMASLTSMIHDVHPKLILAHCSNPQSLAVFTLAHREDTAEEEGRRKSREEGPSLVWAA